MATAGHRQTQKAPIGSPKKLIQSQKRQKKTPTPTHKIRVLIKAANSEEV
jgi:hypothetical protein